MGHLEQYVDGYLDVGRIAFGDASFESASLFWYAPELDHSGNADTDEDEEFDHEAADAAMGELDHPVYRKPVYYKYSDKELGQDT